jgi:hypothetical protein
MAKLIKRNMMLKEMDIRFLPSGKRSMFSIKFVTLRGELKYIARAYVTGLRYDVKAARQRGIQPCDGDGNPTDHVYPVGIDNVIMYNNMEVIL